MPRTTTAASCRWSTTSGICSSGAGPHASTARPTGPWASLTTCFTAADGRSRTSTGRGGRRAARQGCRESSFTTSAGRPPGTSSTRADRKSTRLNSSHSQISYAVFCLKKNMMLIGVVTAIASELRVIAVPLALPLGVVAIFVGIFVALFAFRQRGAASVFQRQKQMRDVEIDRRLRGRSQLEEELRLVESDTAQQLEAIDLPDLAAAEELLSLEEDHVSRIDVLTG